MQLSTFGYSLCSYIAGLIKWRIFAIVYCISNILILALYFVCEAVLLFMLAAGRRLAELETSSVISPGVCAHVYCCMYM